MAVVRKSQPGITRVLPHPGNRKYAVPDRFGPVKVMFTGDSWTENAGFPDITDYLPTSVSGGFEWVNEGQGGTPLAGVSGAGSVEARIQGELIANSPDIAVITTAGINDGWVGTSAANLELAAENILAVCESYGAVPVFVGPPMVSNYPGAAVAPALEWRNETLPAFNAANGLPQVHCRGVLSDDTGIFARYARDTSHLNEEGNLYLLNLIYQGIKAIPSRRAARA